jgi:uncharacterized protein (DUF488 family)
MNMNTQNDPNTGINLFTIGFTKKNARTFFSLLKQAGVKRVIDIRLNNASQLAGFTKKEDLRYFLKAIADIDYIYRPELAPTKEILNDYKKKKITWADYERLFKELLNRRKPETLVTLSEIDKACLLCSEPKADQCHRRLVAEYFRGKIPGLNIQHL